MIMGSRRPSVWWRHIRDRQALEVEEPLVEGEEEDGRFESERGEGRVPSERHVEGSNRPQI